MKSIILSTDEVQGVMKGPITIWREIKLPQGTDWMLGCATFDDEVLFVDAPYPETFARHTVRVPFKPGQIAKVRESFWCVDTPNYGDTPCLLYEDEFKYYEQGISVVTRPCGIRFGHHSAATMPLWASRFSVLFESVGVEKRGTLGWAYGIRREG